VEAPWRGLGESHLFVYNPSAFSYYFGLENGRQLVPPKCL
jgi:hypothetical protein